MSALRNPLFASLWRHQPGETAQPAPPAPAPQDARTRARRAQYDEIGDFLIRHDLELSDANFTVARAHLSGEPAITMQIHALLREHGRLTDAMIARVFSSRDGGLRPGLVGEMAELLARDLAECVRVIAASQTSGVEYRAALAAEVTAFSTDPLGALDRLIRLTSGVVEATRAMEQQLEGAREEAERLRVNLRRAQREADRDHLTGLPNRRHFETRLGAIDPAAPAAVALCDIDDFKNINDQHGHGTGDRVLKFVARVLRSELGEHAVVARYGGEEFVCLFEGHSVAEAVALIDAARERLGSRSLSSRQDGRIIGRIAFSAGVAPIDGDPCDALRLADVAMYAAKRAGKNQVAVAPGPAG